MTSVISTNGLILQWIHCTASCSCNRAD